MSTAHSELNSSSFGRKKICIVCLFSSGADLCTVGALSYHPLDPMSKLGVFQDKLLQGSLKIAMFWCWKCLMMKILCAWTWRKGIGNSLDSSVQKRRLIKFWERQRLREMLLKKSFRERWRFQGTFKEIILRGISWLMDQFSETFFSQNEDSEET